MDSVASLAGPIATLVAGVAPAAASFMNKPKMPTVKEPTPVATPTMPTKDDAAAKAAALREVAKRSAASGRSSTNLYDKQETLG